MLETKKEAATRVPAARVDLAESSSSSLQVSHFIFTLLQYYLVLKRICCYVARFRIWCLACCNLFFFDMTLDPLLCFVGSDYSVLQAFCKDFSAAINNFWSDLFNHAPERVRRVPGPDSFVKYLMFVLLSGSSSVCVVCWRLSKRCSTVVNRFWFDCSKKNRAASRYYAARFLVACVSIVACVSCRSLCRTFSRSRSPVLFVFTPVSRLSCLGRRVFLRCVVVFVALCCHCRCCAGCGCGRCCCACVLKVSLFSEALVFRSMCCSSCCIVIWGLLVVGCCYHIRGRCHDVDVAESSRLWWLLKLCSSFGCSRLGSESTMAQRERFRWRNGRSRWSQRLQTNTS